MYVARRNQLGTEEFLFATEDEARQHTTEALKSEEFMLVRKYVGRGVTKVKISRIAPESNICWFVV